MTFLSTYDKEYTELNEVLLRKPLPIVALQRPVRRLEDVRLKGRTLMTVFSSTTPYSYKHTVETSTSKENFYTPTTKAADSS